MGNDARRSLLAYGVAVLAVAGAVLVRWLLDPLLGEHLPLPTLYGAVAIALWYGGYRPALFTAVLGYLVCNYLFIEPRGVLGFIHARDLIGLFVYLFSCSIIIGFGEAMRVAQRRAGAFAQQLQIVTESMSASVTRCSRDFRYLWVSKPYADWIARPADEIIGRPILDIIGPEAFEHLRPHFDQVLAGQVVRYEEKIEFRGIGPRWINAVYTPTLDASGVPDGWVAVVIDITDRKRLEEQIRQQDAEKAQRLLQEEAARQAAEASAREAQRAQREERRQREQLRVTLTSIGDAVIVTDAQGLVTFLNPVAQALTGWQPHEAAGQPLDQVFHIVNEETRQPVENPVTKVLRQGVTVGLANHTVLLARDGREIPIDDSGAPIRGEEGTITGVVLVFRDVSEARKAMAARLHLAAIVESSEDAILSKDLDGRITSWNKGAQRLYGYRAEEILGRPLSTLVPPDHPDELPGLLQRLKRGERIERYETVRLRKDGSRMDVSLTISPIRNEDGKIIGASKIARDITARKQAEEKLLESEQRLAAELEAITRLHALSTRLLSADNLGTALDDVLENAIVTSGADFGNIQLYNPQVGALEIVAQRGFRQDFLEYFRQVRVDEGSCCAQAMQSGQRIILEDVELDPAYEPHRQIAAAAGYRAVQSTPLKSRSGSVLGMLSTHFRLPQRVSERNQRLLDLYARHAADLIERMRIEQDLRDADRRKDEFLAMLAHELRNPLAPIRNALHIMKMPGANGAAVERARQMTERQVQHLVRLVDDLLDVSRIMRGRIELRKEPVELADVLARGVEAAQPMIDACGQKLVVCVPPQPLRLHGDATRLAQVVTNLLHNAAKFSERAGHIWLSAGREGAELVVRVRDEGSGIRADLLPHIFELFVQGDRSLERSRGGLGIGLTVVRKLVELHGGSIEARSEGPGQGSEFLVRLPGLKEAAGQEPAEAGPRPEPASVPRRVLVVDDNVDAAESIALLVRHWGHEVRLAFNGPEALTAAEVFHPEIIVLDIGLPGLNGYEVARQLRQQPRFAQTLLAAVTGYGQEEDQLRSVQAGFDHHLTKPVDPEALQRIIVGPAPLQKAP
jgi:PAS domain S-box-containing protein